MYENYSDGMKEDYDNMTLEMSRLFRVYPRDNYHNYEGQQAADEVKDTYKEEYVFVQETETKHEVVESGQFSVADVKMNFQHNSSVEEESVLQEVGGQKRRYKVLTLTKVEGPDGSIVYIKAFGRKLPDK